MRILELSRAGLLGSAAIVVAVAVCVWAGLWQLDRREERAEINRALTERMADEPVELASIPSDTGGLTYRRAVVHGDPDRDGTFVVAGRSYRGTPGVHVFTPVRLGPGGVLVNRGWMPAADGATPDDDPPGIEGQARFEGVLLPFPDVSLDLEDRGPRDRWYRMDGDAIRAQYAYPVFPLYLQAVDPAAGGQPPIALAPPEPDPGPHLSYAVQWFSFATIFLVGWVVLLLRRPGG